MTQPTPYRVLVTGSRDWADAGLVWSALNNVRDEAYAASRQLIVVHGACPSGADADAAHWAEIGSQFVTWIQVEAHPAKGHPTQDFGPWPGAGPRRNQYMVSLGADVALAFIGPCTSPRCRRPGPHLSHGASGCADLAEKAGIPVRRWTA
ncbi:SLOG family protein [Streptomyces sp. NBC_01353]|uniref:SLOG family protein n=1 Tax=Streptomyces sp. NBC_01353 TaxID=2903835 RepID=UPI002E374E4C|nr:SLOG family protein [Streptomyces sp. NBC_01353]